MDEQGQAQMMAIRETTGTARLSITLVPVPQSASVARVFVRHQLLSLGYGHLMENACAIASELVANAVARTASDDPAKRGSIRLYLGLFEGHPLLEVWDSAPEMPVLREPDWIAESGRGLRIVQSLAAQFGWRPDEKRSGKTVWALLK